jgi:GTP-binding protein LepA
MEEIRNFCIISHIDHGKSTLADRFLEITGTIPREKLKPQYLDSMNLEREKGITIKMHPVRMVLDIKNLDVFKEGSIRDLEANQKFIFNLIDTPGHADFSYEVSRSLAAVEGAILLVDATQGIQAQTLYNFEMAKRQGLKIIGAVNKIDLKEARIEETKKELAKLMEASEEEIFEISAKTGKNVDLLLRAIIEKIPPPEKINEDSFKALIFDSKYDSYSGVILYVRIFSGKIKAGETIYFLNKKIQTKIKEVGYFTPELKPFLELKEGEIGYIKTNIKNPEEVIIGDTISTNLETKPLPGYSQIKPVLYLSLYPVNSDDFTILKTSISKLKLQDPAIYLEQESKYGLGQGFRAGFLGALHAEITIKRLKEEFNLDLLATTPQVVFKAVLKSGKETDIYSAQDFPDLSLVSEMKEPYYELEILIPNQYYDQTYKLLRKYKGEIVETKFLGTEKMILKVIAPLKEIITDFYEDLKTITNGFGSFSANFYEYRRADLVKLEILIAGEKEELFSKIVDKDKAFEEGKKLLLKLKNVFPQQQFEVPLQAAVFGKIIAREDVAAKRKDVTAPLYGGDFTRKRKLLEKQKKGKKELKEKGQISKIPSEVFLKMFSN